MHLSHKLPGPHAAESQSESHWDVVGNLDRSARIAISSAGSPATVASLRILPSTGAVISTAVAPVLCQ